MLGTCRGGTQLLRRLPRLLVATASLIGVAALTAAPAEAKVAPNPAFLPFKYCPAKEKGVVDCVVATTLGGEVKLGNKSVPIKNPIVLQGGLRASGEQLVGATEGQTFDSPPQTVPGGLVGIEGLGGEVSATTELAGAPSAVLINQANTLDEKGIAVVLPLKVTLHNAALGEHCEIGSEASPILLHLTTGTTSPPAPNSPISGSRGTITLPEGGEIEKLTGAVEVDNAFSTPEATGCGGLLAFLVNPVVNLDIGLPAASGHNTAILEGNLELAQAKYVRKAHVLPKT